MSTRAIVLASAANLIVGVLAAALPQHACAQAQVNAELGPILESAIAAVKNKRFDAALAKLKEAEGKKKSAFDQFKIDETLASIYSGQGKYAELAVTYERLLAAPEYLSQAQKSSYPRLAIKSYSAAGQHGKVIEQGKRWLADKPGDLEVLTSIGRAYYSAKSYKLCQQTFESIIDLTERSGKEPTESSLDLYRYCADAGADTSAETRAYEKLVRYHPNPDRWQEYLRRVSSDDRDDVASYNWLRLMHDTGAMRRADDYTDYGVRAISEYGVPCEAQRVLEDGLAKKVLGVDAKLAAREQNRLKLAKEAVQADEARMSTLAAEAEQDATGQKQVELGMIHFGCARYEEAAAILEKGLKKGGVSDAAHAKLVLGIAQLRSGKRDAARATFKAVSADRRLGKVASAWILRSYS